MVELGAWVLMLLAAAVLTAPLRRRLAPPAWLERRHGRGRPGVPVTAWLLAALAMAGCWLAGEARGAGGLLLLLWVGGPLAALLVTRYWRRRPAHGAAAR